MRIFLVTVLLFLFIFSLSASDQSNSSGQPGAFDQSSSVLRSITMTSNQIEEKTSFHTSNSKNMTSVFENESIDLNRNKEIQDQHFYKSLENLDYSERGNALIEIEIMDGLSSEGLSKINNIQLQWNSGNYEQAINELSFFETEFKNIITGIGITWKEPRIVSAPEGVDVQIGARSGMSQTDIDFDESTGHLFAAILFDDGTNRGWTVNISTDDGATWYETYYWNSGTYALNDIDAGAVAGYFWVGYIVNTAAQDNARMRRFHSANGTVDNVYNWISIFDFNIEIMDVAVFTNADNWNNRIYYYAITADDSLRFFWDDTAGVSWSDYSPGIANADHGLDVCWNYNNSNYYAFVSYVNTQGMLHVTYGPGPWTDLELTSATSTSSDVTSIAAYQDTIIIVYEGTNDLTYRISYNEGTSWTSGTVASGTNFHKPHVTGRKNGGFAVAYSDGAPALDAVWFVRREYSIPGWSTPLQINENDVGTAMPIKIEWLPPVSEPYAHGATFWSGGNTYFDRIEEAAQPDPPDISVSPTSFNFTVNEGGTDTDILTIYNTAVAGSEDLIWNINDRDVTLVTEKGKNIPVKVLQTTEYITGSHAPSAGAIPAMEGRTGNKFRLSNKYVELLSPADYGYGPESSTDSIFGFVLSDPTTFIPGDSIPDSFFGAAEFGSDFSFMYAFNSDNNDFVMINVNTGVVTVIGNSVPYGGEGWCGLAWDPTDGTMYATSTSVSTSSLYTIDLANGNATRIGDITNVPAIIAIAINNAGHIFGYDIITDSLVAVNKVTAAGVQIGPLGFDANFGQGMDFDEDDGTLYLAAFNNGTFQSELRTADTATGLTSLVGVLGSTFPGGLLQLPGFGVAASGECPWISESPTNGTIPAGSSQNVTISVDAAGLSAGVYNCELRVNSNDPDEPLITVPYQCNTYFSYRDCFIW
jgi:hypothetical protein